MQSYNDFPICANFSAKKSLYHINPIGNLLIIKTLYTIKISLKDILLFLPLYRKTSESVEQFAIDRLILLDSLREWYINDFVVYHTNHHVTLVFQ